MAIISKDILFGQEARTLLMEGSRIISQVVGTTLGPRGRNVALSSKYGGAIVVHDGITVANEVKLDDPKEDIGVMLIREAARKTNDSSGDGTTTATILAYEILKEGNSHVIAGANPMLLIKGIEKAVKQVVKYLKETSEPIKDSIDRMIQIATVSAADKEIGGVVAQALKKVGKYGVVTVEKGSELGFVTEYKDGMEWDKGWIHPVFVLRILDGKLNIRLEAKVDKPYILITDHSITSPREILPFLTHFLEAGLKNLLIISDGIERQAMTILAENFERGVLNVLPVPAPSLGEHKRDGLEDIAILTNGVFISKEMGKKVEDTKIEELGQAESVLATKESTVIIGGKGDKEKVKDRAKQIEEQLNQQEHEYLKEKYKERLAKLTSGVAVIKVGTASDTENREKLERVKDAIGATKAAVEDGIVEGGGLALFNAIPKIEVELDMLKDEVLGIDIVKKALSKPLKLLAENAGINGEVVINEILMRKEGIGYDVVNEKYVNMKEAGIIDPVKVTISAIQNAASVASMILTTEALVVDKPSEREKKEQNE